MQEVKYIDLHNLAGMTALHVATLNGSAATVQAILAHGGSVDAEIRGNNLTPWLSRGSTALHIAAARGFHAVVDVLLAAQTPDSGQPLLTFGTGNTLMCCTAPWGITAYDMAAGLRLLGDSHSKVVCSEANLPLLEDKVCGRQPQSGLGWSSLSNNASRR